MLKGRQRRLARQAARKAWIECGQDSSKLEATFDTEMKSYGMDPSTILLLLQIALKLWEWWRSNHVSEPSVVVSSSEPQFDYEDENESD